MRYTPVMKLALATSSLLVVAACGGARPATTPAAIASTGGAASAGVRSIDWANRTYQSGEGTFTVVDGEASFAFDEAGNEVAADAVPADPDGFVERGYFNVAPPQYGDVTGDGVEEALIITVYNGGGTGQFDGIDVYAMREGQPVIIGGIPGGDRGDGGIAAARVEGGVVVIERMSSGPDDGACCPSRTQHERWTWTGGKFVEDEAARRLVANPVE